MSSTQISVVVAILCVALAICLALGMRLRGLHANGTPVLLRTLPVEGEHGWRHGVLRYGEAKAEFFKLRALHPGASATIYRRSAHIINRRPPRGTEQEIMDHDYAVVRVTGNGSTVEIASNPQVNAAFLSWIEARPSARLRTDGL